MSLRAWKRLTVAAVLACMAAYVRDTAAALEAQAGDDFLGGKLGFVTPPNFA